MPKRANKRDGNLGNRECKVLPSCSSHQNLYMSSPVLGLWNSVDEINIIKNVL